MKELGVYIHIPFCKQKCLYCDFVSFAQMEDLQEKYIQALKDEIKNWKAQKMDYIIKTIYIGGGTPSYIDSKYISEILKLINDKQYNINQYESESMPITIEVNPGTVTKQNLEDYKKAGVNRLSIGLQSTKNSLLKEIGRIHNYEEFLEIYGLAREVGFSNINVDLMIGLPNQTIKDIKKTLEDITNLKPVNPEHISVYSLIIEENTPLQRLIETSELELPDEEAERQMYWYVKDFLELKGYKHYEISNFAKQGFEAKHNIDCWEQNEYIGFGVAAHSYMDNKRFCNISELNKYIENCNKYAFKDNVIIEEIQSEMDKMKEYMILGLRKIDGVSIQAFENKFNKNPIIIFRTKLQKLHNKGLILIDGNMIRLSNKGLDLANLVWREFI